MAEKKIASDLTSTIHLGQPSSPRTDPESHGELFAGLSPEEQDVIARLVKSDGMLITHRGAGKGSRFLVSGTTSIGRDPSSDVFLDDVTISRKHASITFENDHFILEDLGSLNGTYVNGDSIARTALTNGDEIQIGKFHMLFYGGK